MKTINCVPFALPNAPVILFHGVSNANRERIPVEIKTFADIVINAFE